MADFFPRRDAELLEWGKNFAAVVAENVTQWNISPTVSSDLTAEITAYRTAYELAKGENGTKALIIDKNDAREAMKTEIRSFKNKFIDYNDLVTNADRQRLGLPPRDHKLTPQPPPASRPILQVLPTNNRQHKATALNQTSGKKTKPNDADWVQFVSEIRDTPPDTAGDLRHSISSHKVVRVFNYREADRGKKVFYAACYKNAKGDEGSWSDIIEAIIP
ncbi:hypothetical protein FACS1894200_13770 [Spirochaetia bacterium]|nr:hypothetical protein FACS1894200_13770 [Spirochaetia bacterium]